jgi:hypothetical protein
MRFPVPDENASQETGDPELVPFRDVHQIIQ